MVREERIEEVRAKAELNTEERLLDLLLPPRPAAPDEDPGRVRDEMGGTRQRMREQLRDGKLDDRMVEVDVQEKSFPSIELITGSSMEEVGVNLRDMMPGLFQGRSKRRRVTVAEARERLLSEEEQKLIDMDAVAGAAVERVEQAGIIFVDEIDKIAGREGSHGPEVSREGVQRDILPIVEGTTVNTKHGMVRTDHILFIAAGAFHVSKPSDLIPELQGRFPIRVELEPLGQAEFVRILTEPRSALIKQYTALLATEGVDLRFTDDGVATIAEFATIVNERTENIGARRLHTVMERLLDEVSFEAPTLAGEVDYDRRALRAPHAGGHRQERRSVPLHTVICAFDSRSARGCARRRSLRTAGLAVACRWLVTRRLRQEGTAARAVRARAGARDGGHAAADRRRRLSVVRGARHECRRPEARRHRRRWRSTRSRQRRRPRPRSSARWRRSSRRCRCGRSCRCRRCPPNGSPPPPIPLPPGVDRGAAVAVKETLTPEARVAVELPVDKPDRTSR